MVTKNYLLKSDHINLNIVSVTKVESNTILVLLLLPQTTMGLNSALLTVTSTLYSYTTVCSFALINISLFFFLFNFKKFSLKKNNFNGILKMDPKSSSSNIKTKINQTSAVGGGGSGDGSKNKKKTERKQEVDADGKKVKEHIKKKNVNEESNSDNLKGVDKEIINKLADEDNAEMFVYGEHNVQSAANVAELERRRKEVEKMKFKLRRIPTTVIGYPGVADKCSLPFLSSTFRGNHPLFNTWNDLVNSVFNFKSTFFINDPRITLFRRKVAMYRFRYFSRKFLYENIDKMSLGETLSILRHIHWLRINQVAAIDKCAEAAVAHSKGAFARLREKNNQLLEDLFTKKDELMELCKKQHTLKRFKDELERLNNCAIFDNPKIPLAQKQHMLRQAEERRRWSLKNKLQQISDDYEDSVSMLLKADLKQMESLEKTITAEVSLINFYASRYQIEESCKEDPRDFTMITPSVLKKPGWSYPFVRSWGINTHFAPVKKRFKGDYWLRLWDTLVSPRVLLYRIKKFTNLTTSNLNESPIPRVYARKDDLFLLSPIFNIVFKEFLSSGRRPTLFKTRSKTRYNLSDITYTPEFILNLCKIGVIKYIKAEHPRLDSRFILEEERLKSMVRECLDVQQIENPAIRSFLSSTIEPKGFMSFFKRWKYRQDFIVFQELLPTIEDLYLKVVSQKTGLNHLDLLQKKKSLSYYKKFNGKFSTVLPSIDDLLREVKFDNNAGESHTSSHQSSNIRDDADGAIPGMPKYAPVKTPIVSEDLKPIYREFEDEATSRSYKRDRNLSSHRNALANFDAEERESLSSQTRGKKKK